MTENGFHCPECKALGTGELGAHELRVTVGDKTVKAQWLRFLKCRECGFYELSAQDARLLQMRAALTVLRDCGAPSPDVLKFARKALGLRQADVTPLLSYAAETVSRIENGSMPAPAPYAPALGGLLDHAIVLLMGGDPDAVIERSSQPTPPPPPAEDSQRISRTG